MLVLTRKRSEMIQIGEGIVIKIIHTGRNAVKIGVQAPADVRVMRAELCDEPQPQTLQSLVMERRNRLQMSETSLEATPAAITAASI